MSLSGRVSLVWVLCRFFSVRVHCVNAGAPPGPLTQFPQAPLTPPAPLSAPLTFFSHGLFRLQESVTATTLVLLLRQRTAPVWGRRGKRLGLSLQARPSTRSSAGPSLGPSSGATGHARPKVVPATASWTATEEAPHQRLFFNALPSQRTARWCALLAARDAPGAGLGRERNTA